MKIGLLTYFGANNAGQYWQAVATMRALEKHFSRAEIFVVPLTHRLYEGRDSIPRRLFLKPWRIPRRIESNRAYEFGRRKELRLSGEIHHTNDYEKAMSFLNKLQCDLLVVGSDVTLKLMGESYVVGGLPMYWLSTRIRTTKALLGSSADHTSISNLDDETKKVMKESVRDFKYIGVRDRMTSDLIKTLDPGLKVDIIPDPTFSLDIQKLWVDEALSLVPKRKRGERLVAINLPSTNEVHCFVDGLRKQGFHILWTKRDNARRGEWCSSLTPTAWAGLPSAVDLVVTMSFHETIFAMKQGCPVISVDASRVRFNTETGFSKIRCLQEDFGTENIAYYNFCEDSTAVSKALANLETVLSRGRGDCISNCDELGMHYDKAVKSLSETISN